MNKFYILVSLIFLTSCNSVDRERVSVNSDNGIKLVIQDRLSGASSSNRYSIYWDKQDQGTFEIFTSDGGTSPKIIWLDQYNAFICTAYQMSYSIKSHLDYPNENICFHHISDNTDNACKNISLDKEQYNLCSK